MGLEGLVRVMTNLLYQKSSNAHEFHEYSSAHRNRKSFLLLDLFLEASFIYHSPTDSITTLNSIERDASAQDLQDRRGGSGPL